MVLTRGRGAGGSPAALRVFGHKHRTRAEDAQDTLVATAPKGRSPARWHSSPGMWMLKHNNGRGSMPFSCFYSQILAKMGSLSRPPHPPSPEHPAEVSPPCSPGRPSQRHLCNPGGFGTDRPGQQQGTGTGRTKEPLHFQAGNHPIPRESHP